MKMIKELKQDCASYGPTAPYTVSLVEALVARWMSPHDWKTVDKLACLEGNMYFGELNMMTLPTNRLISTKNMT